MQISHFSLLVTRITSARDLVVMNQSIGLLTHFHTMSLFAAGTYNIQVRAHNPRGSSRWSDRLLATTPLPTTKPKNLGSPSVLTSKDSCNLILKFDLPQLDEKSVCHGVESVDVQVRTAGSAQWRTVISHAVSTQVDIEGQPEAAAIFRLVSRNRNGVASSDAPPSLVVVPGLENKGTHVPIVRATGSASFTLELPTISAACQSSLAWIIFASVGPTLSEASQSEWSVLATQGQGMQYSVDHMRCPTSGCKFRVRPDVRTFDDDKGDLMGPIVVAHNLPLPMLEKNAARIEVLFKGVEWNSLRRRELR